MIEIPGQNKAEIGEPIEVFESPRIDVFCLRKCHTEPFGAPDDCAGKVQFGGGTRAARENKGFEWFDFFLVSVDLVLEPDDGLIGDLFCLRGDSLRCGELGSQREQVVLNNC